ncbi:MAG TPA: acyl-CoA dehydratase activase [Desulfomonilaceae bacterium]|nr:acyl-CoA dehydratase activase [Desulfomonilaceae bacterium]
MEALGMCLGASTLSLVRVRKSADGIEIVETANITHEGNPRKTLLEALESIPDIRAIPLAVTGRKFINFIDLTTISEPEAVERAFAHILPQNDRYRVVVSAGGETFLVYHMDEDGKIQGIQTGNKCASGTGEFFLQQIGRMNLTLEDVARLGISEEPHKVSGRCSVFCKSDCTHALNKGVPKGHVVAGLAKMMAGKVVELLKKLPKKSVVLVGGSSRNKTMIHYLAKEIEDLFIPEEAPYFEALGAALWALDNPTVRYAGPEHVFKKKGSAFKFLKPLEDFRHMVHFNEQPRGKAESGDRTILGLDVGSTTTKGVIMRCRDKAILAADYLRTDGDPVAASRNVYRSLAEQIDVPIDVVGLGVTGSGRQIAGLHAMTDGVINEIIAHAAAAVHFDPEVDTIFEIGGQDAKYTYITNSVPSDYAMNEACSAGTGSFLEESAKESLGLKVTEIGKSAYMGTNPPNFNDQCAAFIGSDIKNASQEGIPVNDIVAGLVYSICMNYSNRVKGNRPVGKKVFMQGGVCYNEAIPAAMAALTGKEIVVPPEPGLMGAFGVALEVERRIERGLMKEVAFDLNRLAGREVKYKKTFVCGGGKEKCDRRCEIARIEIEGETYPFGGACNRYVNLIRHLEFDKGALDMIDYRQRLVFRDLAPDDPADTRPTIGMNRSFLVNTYFPFFNAFFKELGYRLMLPDKIDPVGVDQQAAAFCFPVEIAHGSISDLLRKDPDMLFIPHIRGVPTDQENSNTCTCVFVQGEAFYLGTTFDGMRSKRIITPYLDLSRGFEPKSGEFVKVAAELGQSRDDAARAFNAGMAAQAAFRDELRSRGAEILQELKDDPEAMAVVVFGRPYNSFAAEANKGIPAKFASRGYRIIPFDMLAYEDQSLDDAATMYWSMGRMILKGSRLVKNHPQLFGTYISNFSCGPDSFIVGYFREEMGRKPSLTLELDSHTADAGLETRIEAFLDIVQHYRELESKKRITAVAKDFEAARCRIVDGKPVVVTVDGRKLPLTDPSVRIIIPAMGRFGHYALVKTFRKVGINAYAVPPADEEVLKIGRGNSTCKECLPLQTTVGSMLNYFWNDRPEGEVSAYFMPGAGGPCRFGQYNVFSRRLIERHRIPDAAVLTLNAANGYMGLGDRFTLPAWRAIVISDVMYEIWSTLLAAAQDRESAIQTFYQEWEGLVDVIHLSWKQIRTRIESAAQTLSRIPLKMPYEEIPKISLIGEIYVRNDPISLQNLVEKMADRGFIVRTSQTSEWVKYVDWLIKSGIEGDSTDIPFWIRYYVKRYFDRKIRNLFAPSGLFFHEVMNVEDLIQAGEKFISPKLTGEAILTVGAALHEVLHPACGIISIGPFGCMPSRIAEAVLSEKFTTDEKLELLQRVNGKRPAGHAKVLSAKNRKLPFLAIETDGNAFPQIIEARLEAFSLQARRLHEQMLEDGHR